ncbi:hypothetical protein FQZ97_760570 [compost metagenome]
MVEHLGHGRGLAAGHDLDGLAGHHAAGGHAAPEDAAALAGVGRRRELLHPLHREREWQRGVGGRHRQVFEDVQQRGAAVAAPGGVGRGVHHVPALEGRDRHGGHHGDAGFGGEGGERCADVGERERAVGHGVELVDREHDGRHTQQLEQQRVAAGLHQQLEASVLPVQLGGIDQHHGRVGGGGSGHHVARVLLMARRVADDELAGFGVEVAVSHVDGDALLALGRQTVGQQREIGLTLALHAGQVVLQHGLAVHQQAADQRALAIVHRAAGDEL